jgi:hypothetical protein
MVGKDWKSDKPLGIKAVASSSTNLVFDVPRTFMEDTSEDKSAVYAR